MADNFDNIRDPYDRLEELEIITTGQSMAMEQMSEQLKKYGDNLVEVSGAMVQLVEAYKGLQRQNHSLQKQLNYLQIWIEKLEARNPNEN